MSYSQQNYIRIGEEIADETVRRGKHILPIISRFFLVSTFLEDGLRMWFQWNEQMSFMEHSWHIGSFLSVIFVVVNLFGQIIPSVMILARKHASHAVSFLFFIIVLQNIAYKIIFDLRFFIRNVAVGGGLLLILAAEQADPNSGSEIFAGVPMMTSESRQPKTYFQLFGRILVALMFSTLFNVEWTFLSIFLLLICTALMLVIILGYKTKMAALILSVLLLVFNFVSNSWWLAPHGSFFRDFLKYDFFQTMSVIGALLLIVTLGPGGVSLDEAKKKW